MIICQLCENVTLLNKGITNSVKFELLTNAHSIVETYSCQSHAKDCTTGICENCTPENIINFIT